MHSQILKKTIVKKLFFALLSLLLLFSSCKRSNKVVISGNLSNVKTSKLYLTEFKLVSNKVIDSVELESNGKFKFKVTVKEPTFFQICTNEANFILLLAEPGEHITISANAQKLNYNYEVDGSASSKEVKALTDKLNLTKSLLDSLNQLANKNEGMPGYDKLLVRLDSQYVEIFKAQRKFSIKFILEHVSSLSSIVALYQQIDNENYVLNQNRDVQYVKIVADSLSKYFPTSEVVKILNQDRERLLTEFNKLKLSTVAQSAKVTAFPDLSLPSVNGDIKKLSDIKSKLILLNFWSPQNEESLYVLKSLKEIYPKYKQKGLEIYNIALISDIDRWKEMVKEYDLAGINVIDKATSDVPYSAKIYNISGLPANYLINSSGIITKNIFGQNLDNQISQLLR